MSVLDEVVNRKGTHCIKWDSVAQIEAMKLNPDAVSMTIADMDWRAPEAVTKAVVERAQHGIFGYTLPAKVDATNAVIDWLDKRNGWKAQPDQIGFALGVVDIISMAICSMTQEGDAVITNTPLYGHFKSAVEDAKRNLVCNPLLYTDGGYAFDFDLFEAQIAENDVKMFILCNPQNPTGRVWTRDELTGMIEICKKHNVIVVSDEIHSDLILPGYTYTPAALVAENLEYNNIVTMKSPSKTFNLAGLQFGYYVTPNPNIAAGIEGVKKYHSYPSLPNNFAVAATIAAYTEGEEWLAEVCEYIQSNYFALRDFITETFPEAKLSELQGTYLAWLDVSYLGISEDELQDKLTRSGIRANTTSSFGITDGLFIRLNIACPKELLDKALVALGRALS